MDFGVPVLLGTIAAEILLSGTFFKPYFMVGLPIFWRETGCDGNMDPPLEFQLEDAIPTSSFAPLVFRKLDDERYGFRESAGFGGLFKLNYTPLMHGLLTFDSERKRVRVIGLANWYPIVLVAWGISVNHDPWDPVFVLGGIAVVAVLYFIQARRFREVGEIAATKCAATEA